MNALYVHADDGIKINKSIRKLTVCYCNFAYSALACFRMGMSGSASYYYLSPMPRTNA